jgi:hypothetical protein
VDAKNHAGVVQLDELFLIDDEPYARVTWGKKLSVEAQTQCQA